MKKDMRGSIIDFMKVHDKIPRDEKNDPCFKHLGEAIDWDNEDDAGDEENERRRVLSVLTVFTTEEVVLMVNRFLFNMEYGRSWHRKWERSKAEKVAPLKAKVRSMFNISSTRATKEQLLAAQAELDRESEATKSSLPTGSGLV